MLAPKGSHELGPGESPPLRWAQPRVTVSLAGVPSINRTNSEHRLSQPPKKRRIVAAAGALVVVLAVAAGLFTGLDSRSSRHWIAQAVVAIADAWVVPEVALSGFAITGPTTVVLDGLQLTARDDDPILEIAELELTLAAPPSQKEPLRIARLKLTEPTLWLRPDPESLGFVPMGFSPFLEAAVVGDDSELKRAVRPSEVLELRHVEIIDGTIILSDGSQDLVTLDGIDLDLQASPTATPAGTPGHHLDVTLGQPPGFTLTAAGDIDIDHWVVWIDDSRLTVDLADPATAARLTPGLRAFIDTHELRGTASASLQGRFDLHNPLRSKASLRGSLSDVHGAAGQWHLPIDSAELGATLADSLVEIDVAQAVLLGGSAVMTSGSVAVADAELALAADVQLAGLQLHQLLRGDLARDVHRQATLDASGRVYVASADAAVGLALNTLRLTPAEGPPVLALERAELRDLRLHTSGVPITVAGADVDGLRVRVVSSADGPVGWPLPPRRAPADEATDDAPAVHWSERFSVDELAVTDAAIEVGPEDAPLWRIGSVSGRLQGLGAQPATLTATLAAPGATSQASGTLGLRELGITLSSWSFSADIERDTTRALLPPSLRNTLSALAPAGQVKGSGRAVLPLSGGAPKIDLDLQMNNGTVAIPGVQMPVASGTASLSVAGGSTRVANAELSGAGGRLLLPALVLDSGGELTATATASELRLDRITTSAGRPVGLGRLSGKAQVWVAFASGPKGSELRGLRTEDARLTVDGDPVGTLEWTDVDVVLGDGDSDPLVLRASVTAGSGARLRATGSLPVGGAWLQLDTIDLDVDLADPSGRRALPASVQQALADVRRGKVTAALEGRLSMTDPLRQSTAAGTLSVAGGQWVYAGYRWSDLSVEAPVSVADARLKSRGAAVTGAGGRLTLSEASWSLPDATGLAQWSLDGLQLQRLVSTGGSPNTLEGLVSGRGSLDLAVRGETGLTVQSGGGSVSVRDGRLITLPALEALAGDAKDTVGDDTLDVRFGLDSRGMSLRSLQVDLGPVRYAGTGTVRWSGSLDVKLRGSKRPGERSSFADLTARLVDWHIRGTLSAPHVQALPMGIDTRTFEEMASDPAARPVLPEELDEDGNLDELPEPGASVAPPPEDVHGWGDLDNLDDDFE